MALQDVIIMPSDIVPQKTLNNIDSMYYYLKQRLDNAQQITDLIPFISKLMKIDTLKDDLKSLLDEQYKSAKSMDKITEKQESSNNIRSLFISLFSLNGIPSDNIHAHILSFLPTIEFKKIPSLSKHFRYILKHNPYIYNSKGYKVHLSFITKVEELNNTSITAIDTCHKPKWSSSIGINLTAIDIIMKAAFPILSETSDLNNHTIPMSQIKKWKITEPSTWRVRFDISDRNFFEERHNQQLLDVLTQNANKIEKLEVVLRAEAILKKIFTDGDINFHQCKLLEIKDSGGIIFRADAFKNLQYLDIDRSMMRGRINIENVNSIMKYTENTLKGLRFRNNSYNVGRSLNIPQGIQWCHIDVSNTFKVDLSKCDQLIGAKMLGIPSGNIIWPKREDYIIPFVCIGHFEDDLSWDEEIKTKKLKIKALSVYKKRKKQIYTHVDEHDDSYQWKFVKNIKEIQYVNEIEAYSKAKNGEICMILDEESCSVISVQKIIDYMTEDINARNKLMQCVRKWWHFDSASWMKNIALIT